MRRSGIIHLALLPNKDIHSTQLFVNDLKPIALQNVLDHGNGNSQLEIMAYLLFPPASGIYQQDVCNPLPVVEIFKNSHENSCVMLPYRDKAIGTFECTCIISEGEI